MELVFATLDIYKKAFVKSFILTLQSWKLVFFHLILLLVVGIAGGLIHSNDIVSGLIRGFITSYMISVYFASIQCAVQNEKASFKDYCNYGFQILSHVISVFFALMIVDLILKTMRMDFLNYVVAILFSVLCNPLPEIIYLREGSVGEMIYTSYEFVKENFIEWFLPIILIVLMFFGFNSKAFLSVFSKNPVEVIESFLLLLSVFSLRLFEMWLYLLPVLYLLMFVMLFRGNLFLALEKGRRARINNYKVNH